MPLSSFLKSFFSADKKYGSKDRKAIAHLCYCFYRLGKAAPPSALGGGIEEESLMIEERVLTGLFLCSVESNEILAALKPEWNERVSISPVEKGAMLQASFNVRNIFPWEDQLSDGTDYDKLCESFLIQPDLFIRIRPGYGEKILLKLDKEEIGYEFIPPFTIRLPNSFKADQFFELNKEVVIQDYNSQRVAEFMPVRPGRSDRPTGQARRVWDCCAASGGKSIMAYDLNSNIDLIVSDIRDSILHHLKKRFSEAGIKKYKNFVADLSGTHSPFTVNHSPFDLIICDAPCSGSGTWSRTPEQLYFFNESEISRYSSLQQKIVNTVADYLKPGGFLLYITCSVFKKENEEVVEYILRQKKLKLIKMRLFTGYNQKADTLFCALLHKPL